MSFRHPLVFVSLLASGCTTRLDALPEDTIARLSTFGDENRSLFNAAVELVSTGCLALSPEASFTLNDQPPDFVTTGGRGRDPLSAFLSDCAAPSAGFSFPPDTPMPDELVLVVDDQGVALRAVLTDEGDFTTCDFPACQVQRF